MGKLKITEPRSLGVVEWPAISDDMGFLIDEDIVTNSLICLNSVMPNVCMEFVTQFRYT